MKHTLESFLFLVIATSAASGLENPYEAGSFEVGDASYGSLLVPGLDHNLEIWAPNAEGNFPVAYFLTGFAGLVEPKAQSILLEHIASHGFVVVSPWVRFAWPSSQYDAKWLIDVDKWVQDNIEQKLHNDGFNDGLKLDFENTFLFGHSSGNHIIVNYLKLGCHNAKAVAMVDPVDGVDPYGLLDDYCITPGEMLNFETPTLILSAGLDGVPGISDTGGIVPPCAPDDLSNWRFYNALNGRVWLNNATEYGHTDFYNPGALSSIIEFLHFCADNNLETDDQYTKFLAGQIVSMFSGIHFDDCDAFKYLEDTNLMPVHVLTEQKGSGCPTASCSWSEPESKL